MYEQHLIGTIIYMLIMIQCIYSMTLIWLKVKKTDAVISMLILHTIILMWLFFGILEMQSETTKEMISALRFSLFPISFIGAGYFIFVLFYSKILTKRGRWLIIPILLPSISTYWPIWSEKYRHLTVVLKEIENHGHTVWGPMAEINFTITYLYIIAGVVLLFLYALKNFSKMKKSLPLMLVAVLVPFIIHMLFRYKILPSPGFDLTPVSASLFLMFVGLAVFKTNLFETIKNAAMDVYYQSDEAIIILDNENHIIEYNDAFESLFDFMDLNNHFKTFDDLLLKFQSHVEDRETKYILTGFHKREINKHKEESLIIYNHMTRSDMYLDMQSSFVLDNRGRLSSHVLTFKNRTSSVSQLVKNSQNHVFGSDYLLLSDSLKSVIYKLEDRVLASEDKTDDRIQSSVYELKGIQLYMTRIFGDRVPDDKVNNSFLQSMNYITEHHSKEYPISFEPGNVNDELLTASKTGYMVYNVCHMIFQCIFLEDHARGIDVALHQENEEVHLLITGEGHSVCSDYSNCNNMKHIKNIIERVDGHFHVDLSAKDKTKIAVSMPIF